MSNQPTPEQMDAIADALAANRKIEAIKIYREATGKGLKDSKEFIEVLIPKLREEDPEKFAALGKSQGGGCATARCCWASFSAWQSLSGLSSGSRGYRNGVHSSPSGCRPSDFFLLSLGLCFRLLFG